MILVNLTISIGQNGNHLINLVPYFAALFIPFQKNIKQEHKNSLFIFLVILLLVLSLTKLKYNPNYAIVTFTDNNYVDAILDRIGDERYLFIGPNNTNPHIYSTTKHIPYGPAFNQIDFRLDIPYFRTKFFENLNNTNLIVDANLDINDSEIQLSTKEYISDFFSEQPWPCVQNISRTRSYIGYYKYNNFISKKSIDSPYKIYFRKSFVCD